MGYFSSIARHSGVRISGERAAAPVVRVAAPEPLDIEETVIVAPPLETGVRSADPPLPQAAPADAARERAAQHKPQVAATRSTPQAVAAAPPPASAPAATDQSKILPPAETTDTAHTIVPPQVSPMTAEPPSPVIVEHTRSVVRPQESAIVQERSAPVPVILSTPPADTPSPPRYFARTAELVAGRDADPAALQTIVFREVQEWVAAGQDTSRDAAVLESASARDVRPADEIPLADPPEAGAVRIAARRGVNRSGEAAVTPPLQIEEQRFELSIGTISVVVEGDQPVTPRPAVPPRAGRDSQPNTPPRSSRLSRHYL